MEINIGIKIRELRKKKGLSQEELATKLNVSNQAISKWERAESTPDITVLKTIADLFGVSVDYLIRSEHGADEEPVGDNREIIGYIKRRRTVVTIMSSLIVWVIATIVFIILDIVLDGTRAHFLCFAYAVPTGAIVWLVFNSIWHNRRMNYLIISIMMWSLLFAIHMSILAGGINARQLYLLGIPGQIIIVLWSIIGKGMKKK
jgi:transcriptional regulator with XRE-family HTH domain